MVLCVAPWGLSQVPKTISYQGVLTDASGTVVPDGNYNLTFRLYDVATGGTALWAEGQLVAVRNGVFNVILGSVVPIDLPFDKPYWLGVTLGAGTELTPRIELTSSAYSFRSANTDRIHGITAGGDLKGTYPNPMVAENAVTTAKIADGAVTKAKLSASGGSDGEVLKLSGGELTWGTDNRGGLTLPYSGTGTSDWNTFEVINTGTGRAIGGTANTDHGATEGYNQGSGAGVWGGNASGNYGYLGNNEYGVFGYHHYACFGYLGSDDFGVYGSGSGGATGVHGESSTGYGVCGISTSGRGVYGLSPSGYAGYFLGNVYVTGNFTVGGTKSFKMDHPLDPANKYLVHFCVESNEVLNIYNGNVTLDADGEAWIELPAYFEALNKNFRYQLTAIGAPGPNLYIAQEISGNRFKIAGGAPGMEVSWQVTGIRNDPFAEAHRIQVEVEKTGKERGKYLHPKEYGVSEILGIDYEEQKKIDKESLKMQKEVGR